MGDKNFAQGVLRAGLAIANRNRFYAQQAQAAIDRNALIGQVGKSAEQLGGAFLTAEQERQRKAAALSLGGQLGLSPDVSEGIGTPTLAQMYEKQMTRGYVSPQDQAQIDLQKAQQKYYENRSTGAGGENPLLPLTPELQPYAGGLEKAPYNTVPEAVRARNRDLLRKEVEAKYPNATLGQDANGNDIIIPVNEKTAGAFASTITNRNTVEGANARNAANIQSKEGLQKARGDLMLILRQTQDADQRDRLAMRIAQLDRALGVTEAGKRDRAFIGADANVLGSTIRSAQLPNNTVRDIGAESLLRLKNRMNAAPAGRPGGAPVIETPSAPEAPAAPTATGKNGEKYVLQGDQWVLVK